jgi:hypothetical protein
MTALSQERERVTVLSSQARREGTLELKEFKPAGPSTVLHAFQAFDSLPDALNRLGQISHGVGI